MAFMNFLRNDYKARTNRPISMTTATGYVTVLSAMLNWAVRNDYLSEIHSRTLQQQTASTAPKVNANFCKLTN